MLGWLRRRRRRRLRLALFPTAWVEILERNVPLYRRLPESDRTELHGHIQVFLAEKRFEGCGGLQITDEIRVTVAGHACLLLLHRETDYYPRLQSVLVYPETYAVKVNDSPVPGVLSQGLAARLGESWYHGAVVLSWDAVRESATDVHDAQNVVLHEFAHQLDQEDGVADGAPMLGRPSAYVTWARVLGAEYRKLRSAEAGDGESVLDAYGATDPAEFFAVATECFFERPERLRLRHPALYAELQRFYRQDPAGYVTP